MYLFFFNYKKGQNMKNIINNCSACYQNFEIIDNVDKQDIVKLRLRGQGSGYKEGPDKIESNEPLHLCVSSRY